MKLKGIVIRKWKDINSKRAFDLIESEKTWSLYIAKLRDKPLLVVFQFITDIFKQKTDQTIKILANSI